MKLIERQGQRQQEQLTQTTDTVVMISPDKFGFNPQTAETNVFQHEPTQSEQELQLHASSEFTAMVDQLRGEGIRVAVLPSVTNAVTPDAVFPNNWFSHHEDNTLVIYPMLAPNRRAERQVDALKGALKQVDIIDTTLLDLSGLENDGHILEGTGSLVLDRANKVAFAMESPRTTKEAFDEWTKSMDYQGILFHAYDEKSFPVYHTNVVMSIGEQFAVACVDAITDPEEKRDFTATLTQLGKQIIPITQEQMNHFCGNILQVRSETGESKIVMSDTAFNAFSQEQQHQLTQFGKIVAVHIPTIETVGGGSARCMLAEVFPPKK